MTEIITTIKRPSPYLTFWYFLLLISVFSLIFFGALAIIYNDERYFMVCLGIFPSIMLIYTQILFKASDIFSPINFVFLTTFIGVTLQASNIVINTQKYSSDFSYLYSGLFAINMGMLFLILGFLVKVRLPFPNIKIIKYSNWSIKRVYIVIAILTLISISAFYLYFTIFNIGSDFLSSYSIKRRVDVSSGSEASYTSYGYITWAADLIQLSLFILLPIFLGKLSKHKWNFNLLLSSVVLIILGIASTILPFISSNRLPLLFVLIVVLMLVNYTYKPISIKYILIFIISTGIILTVMEGLRVVQTRGLSTNSNIYKEKTSLTSAYKIFAESDNFLGVSKTSTLINSIPDKIDYQLGGTFLLWAIAPIPRTYWPDKPIIKIGGLLGERVYGRPSGSGVPPGYIGELYLNFGWVGVPFGMFILGLWLRYLYRNFKKRDKNKNIILLYIFAMFPSSFVLLSGEFSGTVIQVLMTYIPLILILNFITRIKS